MQSKNSTDGTLCDSNHTDSKSLASQIRDLLRKLVKQMNESGDLEIQECLHAIYQTFVMSTTVEPKGADEKKTDIFHRVRLDIEQQVIDHMEFMCYDQAKALAVAKLVGAGSACVICDFPRCPAGFNIRDLLTTAKESLKKKAAPKIITTTESAGFTTPREEPLPKSVEKFAIGDDTECWENTEARQLAPRFRAQDEDQILQKERRKSLEISQKISLPGGAYAGGDDRRSIRRILRWITDQTEEKCLTPLECYFLIRNCFVERFTKDLSRAVMDSQKATHEIVVRNFQELLTLFAPSLQNERNRLRRSHTQFKQKFKENLIEALERYDAILRELSDFEITLSESDKSSMFIDAINNDEDRILAVTIQQATKGANFDTFKRSLMSYAQNKQSKQVFAKRGDNQNPPHPPTTTEQDPKPENKRDENKKRFDRPTKPNFQKVKKGEVNNVDEQTSEDSEVDEDEDEINLVDIGIEQPDYVKIPTTTNTVSKTNSHYSLASREAHSNEQVELNEVTIANMMLELKIDGRPMEALVDSGASKSLIDITFLKELANGSIIRGASHKKIKPVQVTYADGRKSKIADAVELPLELEIDGTCRSYKVTFLLLRHLQRGILLGRDAMKTLGIQLVIQNLAPRVESFEQPESNTCKNSGEETGPLNHEFCMVVECNGETAIIDESLQEPVLVEAHNDDLDAIDKALIFNEGQDDCHPVTHTMEDILRHFPSTHTRKNWRDISDTEIRDCLTQLIHLTITNGWIEISDGYRMRLVPLADGDPLDTPQQIFRFEVGWTLNNSDAQTRTPWNSQKSIDKLSPTQRKEWDKQIQEYLNAGWWIEDPEGKYAIPSATVFPVLQSEEKSTTVRPCSDIRIANGLSPRISSNMLSVANAVWKLRSQLKPGDRVFQLDLAKAFYRIHTVVTYDADRVPVVLRIGNKQFISDRLVFGLACGPQGLVCSQLIVEALVRKCAQVLCSDECKPISPIVVMDDFLFVGAADDCSQTIRLHDIAWNLTGFDCPAKKRSEWDMATPTRWLGQKYAWDPDNGILSMKRSSISIPTNEIWTKRKAFRVAGQFTSNTNTLSEAMARTHADCIRAISGKMKDWDKKLDKETGKYVSYHFNEASTLWNRAKTNGEDNNIPLLYGISSLQLYTDASAAGMGMVLSANGRILFAEGKLFKENSKSWHVNRRELYALARAILKTDALIHTLRIKQLTAHTDSRVARAQTDPWRSISSKSLERQVLLRLKNCITEISGFWKTRGTKFTVQYIEGETNVEADALSRVRSNGPERATEINMIEIDPHIDDTRGFIDFKHWLTVRQLFFGWSRRTDTLLHDPAKALRTFIAAHQVSDSTCEAVRTGNLKTNHCCIVEEDGLITRNHPKIRGKQIVIPDSIVKSLMAHLHRQSGHSSLQATLAQFFQTCYHSKARKIAKKVIACCEGCNRASNRTNGQTQYGPVSQPPHPFHTIGLDLYGPLQRKSGSSSKNNKRCILTFCDRLTGWTHFRVLQNGKVSTITKAFEDMIYLFGPRIRVLYTDGGTQFADSALFKGICKMWGIQHRILPPYTPHLGGFYEIRHKTATAVLRAMMAERPLAEWQFMANIAAARINSLTSADRTSSPHELIFGWQFTFPTVGALENSLENNVEEPEDELLNAAAEDEAKRRLKNMDDMINIWKNEYIERQKISEERFNKSLSANTTPLESGDTVYLSHDRIRRKFADRAEPFILVEKKGNSLWTAKALDDENRIVTVHARHLRRVREEPIAEPVEPSAERQNDESLMENIVTDPPVKKIQRPTHENRFLQSIDGQASRSGRIRRGSMYNKPN